jgi:hypothetical protein
MVGTKEEHLKRKRKISHIFSILTAYNISDMEDFVLTKFLGRTFFPLA